MKLELAEGSAEMLREVLIHSLSELRTEMAYATRKELREFLKKRGELLEGLIRQIEVELAQGGREWISIDRLRHVGILRGLTDWELNIAAQYFQHETLPSHTALFEEGGKADRLFILEEGAVSLHLGEGEVFPIQTPGELIGWSFLVPPYRYTASALTAAPSKFLVLRSPDFHYLIYREPRMGVKIMANVAEVVARRLTHFRLRL